MKQNIFTFMTDLFEVSVGISPKKTSIFMKVNENILYTSDLPGITSMLAQSLPSIYNCQCFNDGNKSFKQESCDTELGHLFEHILLEYLCMEKLDKGFCEATYRGVTNWNWEKDEMGTFYIDISIGLKEVEILKNALTKAIELLTNLIDKTLKKEGYAYSLLLAS